METCAGIALGKASTAATAFATLLYKGQQCHAGQAAQDSPRHRLQHVTRADGPQGPAPTEALAAVPAAAGSIGLADAEPLQAEASTTAQSAGAAAPSSNQAFTSQGGGAELGQGIRQVGGLKPDA